MNDLIIQTEELCKNYIVRNFDVKGFKRLTKAGKKSISALQNLNIQIEKGEVVGLIGANGAGKSTTIKLLTGILNPTSGSVRTFGRDPAKNRSANAPHIGIMMGQRSQLWWDLPAGDSFKLYAKMYRVSEKEYRERFDAFNKILDCSSFMNRPIRQLSLGQRMRCEMVAALIHNPELVFLDEPTIGIDVLAKERIIEFISELNRNFGTTVILTTHDIADMGKIARHIIIIDKGKAVYDGSKDKLMQFNQYDRVQFLFAAPPDRDGFMKKYPNCWFEDDCKVAITNDSAVMSTSELISDIMNHYKVLDIGISKTDIETIVKKIYADHNL